MFATLTDDADRYGYSGAEPFGPNSDYDPMYADAPGDGPKCGGPRRDEDGAPYGCPGCRHCSPPDFEAMHTRFEWWDRPGALAVRDELSIAAAMGLTLAPPCGCYSNDGSRKVFYALAGHNPRLLRAAKHKLARICDESEMHAEALAAYEAWVAMVKAKLAAKGR